jgi:cellulose synthase/poly-beta-1,6-N-acetylglucosamine synthase-like glycosyltransferase/glycosyltransferase involved in cell wall biosynthesis
MSTKTKANKKTMRGTSVAHKKTRYVTHTTLSKTLSAIETFSWQQKLFFLMTPFLLIWAFYTFPLATARSVVNVLSILYFIDALFNIFVVIRSLSKNNEINASDEELAQLDESILPIYTILCPLYKESQIVPQFLEGIAAIDWPKDKLDVMFLLEEDDKDTINAFKAMTLPYYARTVVVPDAKPKTKPKACNYGLSYAKGKYLVIYDAEDIPDPLQLKKAYIGFQKVPKDVKCLQAKLSYYNSRQNLLTRFFTAEYALWFDVTLPGLQSLNSSLPLGGTSNHFETANLIELEGWDPFNVTEDADLGIRLFKQGYRTAIIDSTTYEEATSVVHNWIRQRSRWLKGYMQTYLVHMRHIGDFVKTKGLWHTAIFQLTVGGKILFVLLNPFMWTITALYFLAYPIFGPAMQVIYRPPYAYVAVFSWIFGNFMFIYCYMLAVAKRKQWDLAKFVFLIPIYWFLMSSAAVIGFYQLLFKPHYWEKTVHGLHLGKKMQQEKSIQAKPAYRPAFSPVITHSLSEISSLRGGTTKQSHSFTEIATLLSSLAMTFRKHFSPVFFSQIKIRLTQYLPIFLLLNTDLILARLFIAPDEASTYLILSLVSKGIFLIGYFGATFVSNVKLNNQASKGSFHRLLFFTFFFPWIGFVLFGIEGQNVIPALFGNNLDAIISYLNFTLFGFVCFGLSLRMATYNVVKQKHTDTIVSGIVILLQIPLLWQHHNTIQDFVTVFAYLGSVNLIVLVLLWTQRALKTWTQPAVIQSVTQDKLSILIFNWRDTKHKQAGGAEVYVQELGKRWAQEGNHVTLFCGNDKHNLSREHYDGIEIIRQGGTYAVYLFAFITYLFKFRGKYDVIIDCENGLPFFTPLFAKEQVILLIHHVHQEIFQRYLRFPLNTIAKLLEGKFMPIAYQNKHIVTVSKSSRRDIFSLGFTKKENIHVIPNGVSQQMFVNYHKTNHPSFIYLGRLREYKNIDIAIKAFAKVVRIQKDATLAIVGQGDGLAYLNQLVHSLNIASSVTFHGQVTEHEKARLLSIHWAALQPSQMEGWGITVIESNAAGTPVIAARVNGLQDSVIDGQTGLLVPVKNTSKFANAMMRLIQDENLRLTLSQQARVWAHNFHWDNSASAFFTLINKKILKKQHSLPKYGIIFSLTDKLIRKI